MNSGLLEKALARREELLRDPNTNAFRLFCGHGERIPGFIVDKYADVIVFQIHEGRFELPENEIKEMADWYREKLGVRAVYSKRFVADRSHSAPDPALHSETPLSGDPVESEITVLENGLKFKVRPYDGYSTGIFLDQRENRKFLGGRRVLNCFAYTCAFSVALASRGAQVTSVDVSKKVLEWGKENFALNGIDLAPHRFFADDVFENSKRAQKRGDLFDLVIVDPPSFSRTKEGKVFSIAKDIEKLLGAIIPLVEKNGRLFFSSNYSSWDSQMMKEIIEKEMGGKRPFHFENTPAPAPDFAWETSPLSYLLVKLD